MATAEQPLAGLPHATPAVSTELADQWRKLTRAATAVALLTSPALFIWFLEYNGWAWYWSLLATLGVVIVFRGFADLLFRRLIPWPSLFGADSQQLRDEDVMGRRRAWYWRKKARLAVIFVIVTTIVWLFRDGDATWWSTPGYMWDKLTVILSQPTLWVQVVFVFFLFIANFGILMGPMLLMGISQIRGFEPGDAQWGVKLADVRGQVEAKEEVRRVVTLWQSGEAFERAGGKRERGLLFLGAPGTGKTMLAKAIATGFNSPFVSIPGSGFAQTFIGVDAIIVRYLAWKAKRLARKWGGQCIVFIDEIDAVGMRRQALGGGAPIGGFTPTDISDYLFFGPHGALTGSGDLILETRRWRERMFESRAPERPGPVRPADAARIAAQLHLPRHGPEQRARAQPAARRHGRDRQPAVQQAGADEPRSTPSSTPRTSSRDGSARSRCGCRRPARAATRSTSSARRTSRSTGSTRP